MGSFAPIRARMMRATRLTGCGDPVLGPDSVISTAGFISTTLTPNTITGTAISVENAAGDVCIDDTPVPKFKNYGVEIAFCGVDPELINMFTGQPLVLDASGEVVGFRQNSRVDVTLIGFALEMWSSIAGSACGAEGLTPYGYTLLPFVSGGQLGDVTYENGAVNFTLTGAVTKEDPGWGAGPFNVTRDEDGDPAPLLTVITGGDHFHLEKVTVAPPEASDGAGALGVAATGANSTTTPATLSPGNSYAPANLAAAIAGPFTATPNTAWATGKYVVFRDGSEGHWSGTAWVAGRA